MQIPAEVAKNSQRCGDKPTRHVNSIDTKAQQHRELPVDIHPALLEIKFLLLSD